MERFKKKQIISISWSGQGVSEYALILVLISLVSISVLAALGTSVKDVYGTVYEALTSVGGDSDEEEDENASSDDDTTPPDDMAPPDDTAPPEDTTPPNTDQPPGGSGGDTSVPPVGGDTPPGDKQTPPDDEVIPPDEEETPPDDEETPPDDEETPPPQPPTAHDDAAETFEQTPVTIYLLTNDVPGSSPLDSATLALTSMPANGSVSINGIGTVSYAPDSGAVGTDSFTYTVQGQDGATSNTATVTVTIQEMGPVCDGDNQLPECYVQSVTPGGGTTGVSLSTTTIYVRFNQPMSYGGDSGSVETTSYYKLYQTGNTRKKVSVLSASYNPSTRTVALTISTSDGDWKNGTWYTLSISMYIRNSNDQRQGQFVETDFRTGS